MLYVNLNLESSEETTMSENQHTKVVSSSQNSKSIF